MRQQIKVVNYHLKQYQAQRDNKRYQNRLFKCNQHVLYQKLLNPEKDRPCRPPSRVETIQFWTSLWGTSKHFNQTAPWVSDVEKELSSVPVMPEWSIDIESFSKALKKIRNWKSPGLGYVEGFWVKYFSSLHPI